MKLLKGHSKSVVYLHEGRVYKRGSDETFKNQFRFLMHTEDKLYVPIKYEDGHCYSMDYYPESFSDFLQRDIPIADKIETFEALLNWVDQNNEVLADVRFDSYLEKIESRIPIVFHRTGIVKKMNFGRVHGDLTFGNILLHEEKFLFIDPRGTREAIYYDFGKINQSLIMYYERDKFMDFSRMREIYDTLHVALTGSPGRIDRWTLDFFTMVHLLGAVSFIKVRDPRLAESFLLEGLQIAKELDLKFIYYGKVG